jgi:cytochrome c biogenesis protein CcmG/thiol:disulfide interchange protein DsbE
VTAGRVKTVGQVIALACVAGLLVLLVWKLTHQQHAPQVGSQAPAFTLDQLDGAVGPVPLSEFRGHPVVLNFWASWCPPCKAEAAVLEQEWLQYRPRGVVFLGVDSKDIPSDARTFIAAHDLTFAMLEDGSGDVTGMYGISQLPETYVLDKQGTIVAHFAGPVSDPAFSAKFAAVLRQIS